MKNTNKLLVVLLALAILVSGIAVTTLTTGAADGDVAGINSTVYYMPTYGEILVEDSYGASVSFDNNTKFDATIDEMINSSYLVETTAATSISIHGDGDWFIQKWTGTMTPVVGGEVTLIGRKIDNGFVMFVDGVKVYEYWGASHWFDGADDRLAYGTSFTVEAGREYDVEIYYLELGGGNALEIYATTDPSDLNSGANINNVAAYNLTMEKYVIGDNTGEFNKLVGTGATEVEGDAQCIEANWKHDASIDAILAKTREGESKVVASFSEPIIDKECYVICYDGYIEPKVSGTYVFGATKVDNGFYLNIDGTVAYEFWAGSVWNDKNGNTYPTSIELEAGVKYPFTADFLETNGGQVLELVASVNGADAVSVDELFNFYTEVAEEEGSVVTGTYVATDADPASLTVVIDESTVTFTYNHPMTGASEQAFDYAIVDGAMVLYIDGTVVNAMMAGVTLTDGVPVAANWNGWGYTLVAEGEEGDSSGDESTLDGTYNVDFYGTILYTLTFDNGTLTIQDNNNGAYTGTYTYEGTLADGITVYDADGNVSDIILSQDMGGNPTFQCSGLMMAQPLVKVEDGGEEGGDEGGNEGGVLVLGENALDVPAGYLGLDYVFTADSFGTYTIDVAEGESNAWIETSNGTIDLPYTFALDAEETITFNISAWNEKADTIDVVITKISDEYLGDGSFAMPYILEEGDDVCEFPGGWGYIFYCYEATEDTVVTFTLGTEGAYAEYAINPENQYDFRGAIDGTGEFELSAGDVLYIRMTTSDVGSAPAGDIAFNVDLPGDDNTGDDNTGDDNTGDDNTGDDNTGDDNTGDDNTGDDNTGDDNTGAGDAETEKPVTGVAVSAMALLAAGAAGLGGLKLRKKSK